MTVFLHLWAKQDGKGIGFNSTTGFILPNEAMRAPDASWVRRERLATLTPEQKRRFLPLCPDFVIELHSPSDRVADLQDKLQEYVENGAAAVSLSAARAVAGNDVPPGAQLGWLIVPDERSVYVYRPDSPMAHLQDPPTLSGDPELPGLSLDLADIWAPGF